jgi:SOS response regulatory protein OraA/RecX
MSETEKSARDLALKRLDVREYSASEMLTYLQRKGISKGEAQEVVGSLIEEQLISDQRYAKVVARHQSTRGKGPVYVLNKLRQKGVRMELSEVKNVLGEVSDKSDLERAREIPERRYPAFRSDHGVAGKAFQALLRRGFTSDVARRAIFEKPES